MCALLWNRFKRRESGSVLPLDVEQSRLLEILREAKGPVSFAALRERGIENPATLCYELELAGIALVREELTLPNGTRIVVGVALPEGLDTTPFTAETEPQQRQAAPPPPPEEETRELSRPQPAQRRRPVGSRRLVGAAVALALAGLGGGLAAALPGSSRHHEPARRSLALQQSFHQAAPTNTARAPRPKPPPTSTAVQTKATTATSTQTTEAPQSATAPDPAQLEEEGHRLLEEGRYQAAIEKLKEAVAATGGSPSRCANPQTPNCLTYAYALYDLGKALQLDHSPAQAVGVLQERLQIANQRSTVESALAQARREAAPPPKPQPHPPTRKPRRHHKVEAEPAEETTRSG